MNKKEGLKIKVLSAARDNGISSILFRNAMAQKLGLNVAEAACLSLLGITGISTPTEIARFAGLTTGATTTLLDRLEKRKFIRRKANPNDRRGVIIEIHEEYAATAQKLVVDIQRAHQELIASYEEEELQVIADFLTRFTQNVVEQTKRIEAEDN